MARSRRLALERITLDNGLRVVLIPDRSNPVTAVAVLYDVGFRSEPEGRSGFAHLFEHMMFQGTPNVPKGEFDRLIMGNGGVLNGMTTPDYTAYYEVVPSPALELVLYLEADRMSSLSVTQETLDNQLAVVKEEIRLNVLNRPYGKFPWILLPEILFDTYPNSHDGYGSFDDLDAADLDDVRSFFRRYYTPANAVLVVSGDLDVETTTATIEEYFGAITGRRRPRIPSFAEPPLTEVRRSTFRDPFAPAPAIALGYRVPDPLTDLEEVLAIDVIGRLLCDGPASRLVRRLIKEEGIVTAIDAWIGEGPGWAGILEMRDPTRFQIAAYYPRLEDRDRIVELVEEEVALLAGSVSEEEIDRVVSRMVAGHARDLDHVLNRALTAGPLELQRSDPTLMTTIPRLLRSVTPADVGAGVERWLDPQRRAELDLVPGGAR